MFINIWTSTCTMVPFSLCRSWLGKGHHAATDFGKTRGKTAYKLSYLWLSTLTTASNVLLAWTN